MRRLRSTPLLPAGLLALAALAAGCERTSETAIAIPDPEPVVSLPPEALVAGGIGAPGTRAVPSVEYRAARLFAEPGEYPPEAFGAYGIVAFPTLAVEETHERHLLICRAYTASIVASDRQPAPPENQMVTVWPIETGGGSDALNEGRVSPVCERAVQKYSLFLAREAIRDAARAEGVDPTSLLRGGPYLIAWAPSTARGREDTVVLIADMSDVTTYEQAESVFREWARDIETPETWDGEDGWNLDNLRTAIRHWADKYGPRVLGIFG